MQQLSGGRTEINRGDVKSENDLGIVQLVRGQSMLLRDREPATAISQDKIESPASNTRSRQSGRQSGNDQRCDRITQRSGDQTDRPCGRRHSGPAKYAEERDRDCWHRKLHPADAAGLFVEHQERTKPSGAALTASKFSRGAMRPERAGIMRHNAAHYLESARSSSANYWAIAKGAGIGLLPTYASAIGAKVVPIDIDLHRPFDIWLSYHPASRGIPRVSHMIDWMIEAFNPVQFPWFRDEFIHPNELPKNVQG